MKNQLYSWQNLKRRIDHIKYPIGAEIGVYKGVFSDRLLSHIPGLTLYMIDAWSPDIYKGKGSDSVSDEMRKEYQRNCEDIFKTAKGIADKYGDQTQIIIMDSVQTALTFPNNYFDFVYIDADHCYQAVKADIQAWLPKIKKGGWICGHDYPNFAGVKQAVDEIFPDAEIDSDFTWFKKK